MITFETQEKAEFFAKDVKIFCHKCGNRKPLKVIAMPNKGFIENQKFTVAECVHECTD